MKVEVRCCCVPIKLLGWMNWPDNAGRVVRYHLLQKMPDMRNASRYDEAVLVDAIVLSLATYMDADGRSRLAVKAEGVPLETLRRVPGFVENRENV